MDVEQLTQKKAELKNAFNALEKEKQDLNKRINDITGEQLRIQGAHSLVEEQIKNLKETKNAK